MSYHDTQLSHYELRELETLVQAAGSHVTTSDDLRPRVLESVRGARRGASRQRRLAFAATAAVVTIAVAAWRVESSVGDLAQASAQNRVDQLTAESVARGGVEHFGWSLVDAFTTVRREQAESLGRETHTASREADSAQIEAQNGSSGPSD